MTARYSTGARNALNDSGLAAFDGGTALINIYNGIIGDLPTRDIFRSLSYVANNFAAHACCTCFTVCHYALRG